MPKAFEGLANRAEFKNGIPREILGNVLPKNPQDPRRLKKVKRSVGVLTRIEPNVTFTGGWHRKRNGTLKLRYKDSQHQVKT